VILRSALPTEGSRVCSSTKPLFAPKALRFPVIDCPAFCAGAVIRGPKWRSRDPNVASGSWGVAVTGSWRWVARSCPPAFRA
jgi:hypothetical protein